MPKVFYTDNGSCAVEVGLKMAIQKAHNEGIKNKTKILSLEGSYHGDTFGTMSVGGTSSFHSPFTPFQFESIKIKPVTNHPSTLCPNGVDAWEEEKLKLERIFKENHQELAAVLVEPLIQGASGMNIHFEPWLKELCSLANSYQIPLVFDEVFTGLGRCGDVFERHSLRRRCD